MASTTVPAAAPDADRRTKPRLSRRRRVLTATGILLALVGGTVAGSETAFAQAPPGACTQTCNNPSRLGSPTSAAVATAEMVSLWRSPEDNEMRPGRSVRVYGPTWTS